MSTQINVKILIGAYGRDWTQWIGQPLVVYRDENVSFGSSMTGGNRVRVPQDAAHRAGLRRDIAEAMPTRETVT
ncbi:MAG: hypothetical protein V3T48_11385 [Vicinamibacterales bacterium]